VEEERKINEISTYKQFADDVSANLKALKKLVDDINADGKTVYILAASTRGATIWQSAGIDEQTVQYAVERNPEKVGKYFSAIGVPIISEEEARKNKPDYMIVGPWFFATEIVEREAEYLDKGGKLILPLPKLTIVG
jgi:ABC-type Fe3+-hydroxamate transport system substrate-binding protein